MAPGAAVGLTVARSQPFEGTAVPDALATSWPSSLVISTSVNRIRFPALIARPRAVSCARAGDGRRIEIFISASDGYWSSGRCAALLAPSTASAKAASIPPWRCPAELHSSAGTSHVNAISSVGSSTGTGRNPKVSFTGIVTRPCSKASQRAVMTGTIPPEPA